MIVDVGCGTGAALRHAAEGLDAGVFIGIDPIGRMIELASERTADHPAADRITYKKAPAESLPLDKVCAAATPGTAIFKESMSRRS